MPYQLFVLYSHPEDPAAFDQHYREVHADLGAALPGLRSFTMNWADTGPDGAAPPYHFIAALTWDSKEDALKALGSPEGEAAVADLENFAGAGASMVFCNSEAKV